MLIDELKVRLIGNIGPNKNLSDDELNDIISVLVADEYRNKDVSVREKIRISRELFNSIRGLDILQGILEDDDVTEIMINGSQDIFIEKKGILSKYDGSFSSSEKLDDVIQTIVGRANKRVNEATPIVDTRLPDGSRINVVLKPVAIDGPVVTIRKFPKKSITMEDLIRYGSITREAASFLKELVESGYNIFISGGTGSGKTTFLNALSDYIPKDERIITIEDSAELQIKNIKNLVRLECRQPNTEGENEVTIRDLIRSSLRMRPTRIIVGEVRGPEAFDMLQAMNTGHDGSLSTGHANSPADMLTRLEMMVLMAADMPLAAIKSQIASALDILVHLSRYRDGSRRVSEICEVTGINDSSFCLNTLFQAEGGRGPLRRTDNPLVNRQKLIKKGSAS